MIVYDLLFSINFLFFYFGISRFRHSIAILSISIAILGISIAILGFSIAILGISILDLTPPFFRFFAVEALFEPAVAFWGLFSDRKGTTKSGKNTHLSKF